MKKEIISILLITFVITFVACSPESPTMFDEPDAVYFNASCYVPKNYIVTTNGGSGLNAHQTLIFDKKTECTAKLDTLGLLLTSVLKSDPLQKFPSPFK